MNKCEADSLRLAQERPDLTIVGGYLLDAGIAWGHFWCVDEDRRVIDSSPRGEPLPELYVGVRIPTEEATRAAAESKRWWKRYVRRRLWEEELPAGLLRLTGPWLHPQFYADHERKLIYEPLAEGPRLGTCLRCNREAPIDRSLLGEEGEWHEVASRVGELHIEDIQTILLVCPRCASSVETIGSPVRKVPLA
jgi:hypothetical protein